MASQRFVRLFLLFVALVLAWPGIVSAGDDVWKDATSGSFDDNARWLDGGFPTAGDTAAFDAAGAYDVLFDFAPIINQSLLVAGAGVDVTFESPGSPAPVPLYSLTGLSGSQNVDVVDGATLTLGTVAAALDVLAGGQLRVDTGGTLNVVHGSEASANNDLFVGSSGVGALSILSGGDVSNRIGYVGWDTGSDGSVTVDGVGSTWTNSLHLHVGSLGTGTVGVAGGGALSNTVGFVGWDADSNGTVSVTGGGSTWTNSGELYVGLGGSGTLDIAGGGAVSNADGYLGESAGSDGSATVDGAGSTWTHVFGLHVGQSGAGTLDITNGGAVSSDKGYVGRIAGSDGSVSVAGSGSSWTNTSSLYVGYAGLGSLDITGGGNVSDQVGYVGFQAGPGGSVTVDGSGSTWTNSAILHVGYSGVGVLDITGGGVVSNTIGYIGKNLNSDGTVTLSDSGSSWTNTSHLYVGEFGSGTLEVTNGGNVSNAISYVGKDADSDGTVTVSGAGSLWTHTSHLYLGSSGSGSLDITNGGAVSTSLGAYVGYDPGSDGAVTVDGGGSTWTNLWLYVGDYGLGTLSITGGGAVSSGSGGGIVGLRNNSNGSAIVDGSGSTWVNSSLLIVGGNSVGTLDIANSGVVSNTIGKIGDNAGSDGVVNVSGSGSTWTNSAELHVGESGVGTLEVASGGAVSNTDGFVGTSAGADGSVTVDGSGSTWANSNWLRVGDFGDGTLSVTNGGSVSGNVVILGDEASSSGAANIDGNGSTLSSAGALIVGNWGHGIMSVTNGAVVSSPSSGPIGQLSGSFGVVTVEGGGATWTNGSILGIGGLLSSGGTGRLEIRPGGTVSVGGALNIWPDGTLNLYGGTLRLGLGDPLNLAGGTLNFPSGTVQFDSDMTIDPAANGTLSTFFGSPVTIPVGKGLGVTGTATLVSQVMLNGGTLAVGDLVNVNLLLFNGGTFNLTEADLTVEAGGLFGDTVILPFGWNIGVTNTATVSPTGHLLVTGGSFRAGDLVNTGLVELDSPTARIGGTTLTNQGLLDGTGRVESQLVNQAAGQVRAGAGEHLRFTAAGNTNAGKIEAIGGDVEFTGDLTNAASTGMITGRDAVLRFTGGLTNGGSVALSFGTSDVFGDISNEVTGRIVLSGGGNATFYDDLVNSGVVQVSAGSTAVYFGDVSGSGAFSGTGVNYFEGDLHPGSSPVKLSFGGDVLFGPLARLQMELGGTVGGDQYDRLDVAGDLTPGGTLQVVLIDEFAPRAGDTFDILDWGALDAATFDTVELPELTGRRAWDTSSLYATGEISVIGMMVGDTDVDWDVDTDDYNALVAVFGSSGDWRTDFNEDGRVDLTDFAMQRGNFGAGLAPSGAPSGALARTPEPATIFIISAAAMLLPRKHRLRGKSG